MALPILSDFRLVGGTALSLQLGHRISEDIDLFTCKDYGTVPFQEIEDLLQNSFDYVENTSTSLTDLRAIDNKIGKHLFIGSSETIAIKVDILNWHDPFIYPELIIDGIRLASVKEIALMKLDTISRGGRKKDYWDLAEILESFKLSELLNEYTVKYPYYDLSDVVKGLNDFTKAENIPDPECLKGRTWEQVKKEIIMHAQNIKH